MSQNLKNEINILVEGNFVNKLVCIIETMLVLQIIRVVNPFLCLLNKTRKLPIEFTMFLFMNRETNSVISYWVLLFLFV